MNRKNIILVTSLIPPKNTPRANRTIELAKELAKQGHNVTIYAILGKYDYSDFENKYNLKINNLSKIYFSNLTSDELSKTGKISNLISIFLHKLIEFPDIELVFKFKNILKKESNIDLLITIGMPFPIHWGAALNKGHKNFPKNWIADCGDPYMGNKFTKPFFYFKYIEKWFCRKVDYLTVPIEDAKAGYYKEFYDKIRVIPQGFNFDEYKITTKTKENQVLTFVYAGAFYKGIRDPSRFVEYICTLKYDFKFIIYTKNKSLVAPFKEVLGDKLEIK